MLCFQERKTWKGSNGYTLSPKNLEKTLVNPEIWRKISHKTKSVDLRLQEIQKLVLKSGITVTKIMNL